MIYEWDIATKIFTKKFDFTSATGSKPEGNLLLVNGKFLGTTSAGGVNDKGVIFEWDPVTNTYNKRYDFTSDDGKPTRDLVINNGKLYGMTSNGGSSDMGIVFEFTPNSNQFSKKSDFNGSNGRGVDNRSNLVAFPAKVAQGIPGNCVTVPPITIDDNNNNEWVSITDVEGNAIAEINAKGNNLGIINSSVFINNNTVREDESKRLYLDRSITITPQFQPATPVDIRLYLRNEELSALKNAVNSYGVGSGVNTINDLGIFKNKDGCGSRVSRKASQSLTNAGNWINDYVLSASIEQFSTFYFANKASAALPLTWLEFSCKLESGNGILTWKTDNELNTDGFMVERSLDGVQFDKVGQIIAFNTAGTHEYNYTDRAINTLGVKTVYYRLQQKDLDDQFTYSKIVALSLDKENSFARFYPNPVTNKLNIVIHATQRENVNWRIIDATGRIISGQSEQLSAGDNQLTIDVNKLAKGVYFISVDGIGATKRMQFVKQ